MIRRDLCRLALTTCRAGHHLRPGLGRHQSHECLTPQPDTYPVARVQPAQQVHGRSQKTFEERDLPILPSWASTSSACPSITVAGPTART